ncbi:MAG: hypothetical protein DRP42_05400 [Tenericutes bacterium]|nr:MAG: hypothetical protein DRP42_05400 [Mycoplasmatota bacterium]
MIIDPQEIPLNVEEIKIIFGAGVENQLEVEIKNSIIVGHTPTAVDGLIFEADKITIENSLIVGNVVSEELIVRNSIVSILNSDHQPLEVENSIITTSFTMEEE